MFQFPRFAQYSYVFTVMWPTDVGRVSPFGNSRIKVSLQTPRDLSHATTSFIASHCLGIHRMRLFTWPYNPNKSACPLFVKIVKKWCLVLYRSAFLIAFFCFWELVLVHVLRTFTRTRLVTPWFSSRWLLVTDFQIVKELLMQFNAPIL